MTMNLDAYLQRIGYTGPAEPNLPTLGALVAKHAAAVPFENLNPFLGLPVDLDPAAVERKIIDQGRGGYCFEQNLLLSRALEAIGFTITPLAARVLWNLPEETINARSHMLLRVDLEGKSYLVDVGFGGLTLTGILRLEADVEQPTPHEPFRLVMVDGDWRMQAKVRGEWRSLYRFDLVRQYAPDYEVTNYYLSTNPKSHFVTGLIAALAEPDRRLALRGRELAVHPKDGETERRRLGSAAEIRRALAEDFRIRLPDHPALDARLDSLSG